MRDNHGYENSDFNAYTNTSDGPLNFVMINELQFKVGASAPHSMGYQNVTGIPDEVPARTEEQADHTQQHKYLPKPERPWESRLLSSIEGRHMLEAARRRRDEANRSAQKRPEQPPA